ncbi:MAG: IS30 family transposase [Cycloclasticus sp.]
MGNPYNQLTQVERYQIKALSELGYSARKIARQLGRSNATISRELKQSSSHVYHAGKAHDAACQRRQYAAKANKRSDELIQETKRLLKKNMTPEQIAGRMKLETPSASVSLQTLYRIVVQEGWQNLLPRKGKRYQKRQGNEAGARLIPNRVDIDERPPSVDLKKEIGHWEADTVYGQDSYLVTLTERVSKLLLTVRVKNKTKKLVGRAIKKMLKPYREMCKTITFDNGGEFAGHEDIAKALDCKTYFAKPYCSWQRGLNENTNGLLRRFFPKGMRIGSLSKKVIAAAQLSINMRPRKTLNYLSPLEFLSGKRVSVIVGI